MPLSSCVAAAWLVALVSLALFLAAAKTHGRHVRLERELAGYWSVDFASAYAHPFVSDLWRRDRVRFWILAPAAGAALGAIVLLATRAWPLALVAALLWGPVVAFLSLALQSLARLRARVASDADAVRAVEAWAPGWRDAERRGTRAWWSAVGAIVALAGILAL